MKKKLVLLAAVCVLGIGTVSFAAQQSNSYALFTPSGFIQFLANRGIIPEENVQRAQDIADAAQRIENASGASMVPTIRVSQYIQHADLTYNKFEDVRGLLLVAENPSKEAMILSAKRGCQVVYQIYGEDGAVVYDSSAEERCQTDESVEYILAPGKSRMFEIVHTQSAAQLHPGEYRFVIQYPEYGSGERTVTIK